LSFEILKNLLFQNKIITENENLLLELNIRILNIEKKLLFLEKKITETHRETYRKINDTYCLLFNIKENISINTIVLVIFCILQFFIFFKIF
jgi:hypothetical protein